MSQLATVDDALRRGALLLTPNLRSAQQWKRRLLDSSHGAAAAAPAVLPWRAWTASLFQRAVLLGIEDRVLLNPLQSAAVWRRILQTRAAATLRPEPELIGLCEQAYSLLSGYGAVERLAGLRTFASPEDRDDSEQFAGWLRSYEEICRQERLLPAAAVEDALLRPEFSAELKRSRATEYLLTGFDHLMPKQTRLLNALLAAGSAVQQITAAWDTAPRITGSHRRFLTRHDERQSLCRELRDHVRRAPEEQVFVVVPDLAKERSQWERSLREIVCPAARDPDFHGRVPWEFSTGRPLHSTAMIADALRLLRWSVETLPLEEISSLLRSPYLDWGWSSEAAARFDASVLRRRTHVNPGWTVLEVAAIASPSPSLSNRLRSFQQSCGRQLSVRRAASEWAAHVRRTLKTAGWPGERALNSSEYQLMERFHELLDAMSSVDLLGDRLAWDEYLQQLRHECRSESFEPQNTGAPIQLLTAAEAAGSVAGRVFLPGCDERRWSSHRHPNPLLPWSLQRELGMPGTNRAADLDQAREVLRRIETSSKQLAVSHAVDDADGELRPSPLLAELDLSSAEDVPLEVEKAPAVLLERYDETEALPPLPAGTLHGGAAVLRAQADCAFRAFAEWRLFSTGIDLPEAGMSPADRGSVVHAILEQFWTAVRDRDALRGLIGNGTLREAVLRAISEVFASFPQAETWEREYLQLQQSRLLRLISRWLEREAERPPFRVVDTEKQLKGLAIGPLRVDVRVDRIDEVGEGADKWLALIDYKTGSAKPSSWLTARPEEPQLPLYAVAAGIEKVGAIAFGVLRSGDREMRFRSFPDGTPLLSTAASRSDDRDAFARQQTEWRAVLEELANGFAAGAVSVSPREFPRTCERCGQRLLCRISQTAMTGADEDEPEQDA